MKDSPETPIFLYLLLILVWTVSQSVSAQTATSSTAPCSSDDIDINGNNLIDICDIARFDTIRREEGFGGEEGYGDTSDGCKSICNGYELMRDLDFAAQGNRQPIDYFDAVFNANGYTISNLTINDSTDTDYVGLFRELGSNAEIKGIRLLNINVVGNNGVGGLAGLNEGEITDSCIGTESEIKGDDSVGGLVGSNFGGVISNSCVVGSSTVTGMTSVGGLVGQNSERGIVKNSYAISDVEGDEHAGGLVGYNHKNSIIVNSYAAGNVVSVGNANRTIVGGLVGWNTDKGVIRNSYAIGNVKITTATSMAIVTAGGLIGQNSNKGIIENSYATGNVASTTATGITAAVGGLIGYVSGGKVMDSYAIGRVSDNNEGDIGSLVGSIQEGRIINSYAEKTGIELVGFDNGENTSASFVSDSLRLSTIPSMIPTKIYYQWSDDDWDFGTDAQYPLLRYTSAINMAVAPACGAEKDEPTGLPRCGTLLFGQKADLTELFEGANLVPKFMPDIFSYTLRVPPDTTMINLTPMSSNSDADIYITSDQGSVTTDENGSTTIKFGQNSILAITITVNAVGQTARTTRYTIRLSNRIAIYTHLRVFIEGALQRY